MRLTYIYFLITFAQGSHDFRFDMGRMGIRAGIPWIFRWFYLCAICVRALIKTGKPSALISALHSGKALSFKDIAEVSEQISHLLNCAMENNRKRKLQYLFSHVTLGDCYQKIDIGQPHWLTLFLFAAPRSIYFLLSSLLRFRVKCSNYLSWQYILLYINQI